MGELLDTVDSKELTEWQIFDSLDPIGAWRDDYANGIACALHANMNRKRGSKPFTPQDFMPFMQPSEEEKQEQMQNEFMRFVEGLNAKVATKKQD